MTLNLTPNLEDTDGFYERLVTAHSGLDANQSAALNARLILVLANHIGNDAVLAAALQTARAGVKQPQTGDAAPD